MPNCYDGSHSNIFKNQPHKLILTVSKNILCCSFDFLFSLPVHILLKYILSSSYGKKSVVRSVMKSVQEMVQLTRYVNNVPNHYLHTFLSLKEIHLSFARIAMNTGFGI